MPPTSTLPHTLRPLSIGTCTVRNRIYMSAQTTNFAVDSLPTVRHANYLAERARGGVGLIFTEALEVHRSGLAGPERLQISDDSGLPGFERIAAAVHAHGARLFAQITHSGFTPIWSPNGVPVRPWDAPPHAMTEDEIEELVVCFRAAARRVQAAGFDGLQVHLGHGHLLHRFLSPVLNTRTDAFGGSHERRLRVPLSVVRSVRGAVGEDFPFGIRISSDELTELGPGLAEMHLIVHDLLAEVRVDFVDISQAGAALSGLQLPDMAYGPTPFLDNARTFAAVAGSVPILTTCRFTDLAEAEAALTDGEIAMVGMTRAHIADPAIIRKTLEGRATQIRPCVACNYCAAQTARGEQVSCMVNPSAGREEHWPEPIPAAPPDTTQNVLVIGGGPAGLEFARVAAARGHHVTLWEAEAELGGQLRVGARGHRRADLGKLTDYLSLEINRLGVVVELAKPATASDIIGFGADIVVVASGAKPTPLTIDGWGEVESADHLSAGTEIRDGRQLVILDYEGGWRSASAVETASHHGAEVTVVTPQDSLLAHVNSFSRGPLLQRLARAKIEVFVMHTAVRFTDDRTLTIRSGISGTETQLANVTRIYVASTPLPNDGIAARLRECDLRLITLGDARVVGNLLTSIYDAHAAARSL